MKNNSKIRNNAELFNVISDMVNLREQINAIKKKNEARKNVVSKYLVSQGVASLSNGVVYVSLSEYKRKEFDMSQFRAEHPTLYKQYLSDVPAVRLSYGGE